MLLKEDDEEVSLHYSLITRRTNATTTKSSRRVLFKERQKVRVLPLCHRHTLLTLLVSCFIRRGKIFASFVVKHLLLLYNFKNRRTKRKKKKSDNEQPAKESTSKTSCKRKDGFEGRERRTTGVVMFANT